MKVLFLDIESSPIKAMVWGLRRQNINLDWLVSSGGVLCWSAKWLGERKMHFGSIQHSTAMEMLVPIHTLLSDADVVVHFYGSKFDVPMLNKEFLLQGLTPPAPYAQLDLLYVVRRHFKFPSNKLAYVTKALGVPGKIQHRGPTMWIGCMNGDPKSWQEMERYNKQDVHALESVYHKLLPWIHSHPHTGLYDGRPDACPNCGSNHMESRGLAYTKLRSYRRFRCVKCGGWTRSNKTLSTGTRSAI